MLEERHLRMTAMRKENNKKEVKNYKSETTFRTDNFYQQQEGK